MQFKEKTFIKFTINILSCSILVLMLFQLEYIYQIFINIFYLISIITFYQISLQFLITFQKNSFNQISFLNFI